MPAESRFLRLARLFATGVAATCGLPLDDVEDYRLVIDEIVAVLVESGPGSAVRLAFRVAGDMLVVEGSTVAHHEPDVARVALSDHILGVLTDGYERIVEHGRIRVVASTRLRAAGVG
jgi:hypothetical protein